MTLHRVTPCAVAARPAHSLVCLGSVSLRSVFLVPLVSHVNGDSA